VLPKLFCLRTPFVFGKKNTNSNVLAHINIDCPDERYSKLKIDVSTLNLDGYEFIPIEYVTMHCIV